MKTAKNAEIPRNYTPLAQKPGARVITIELVMEADLSDPSHQEIIDSVILEGNNYAAAYVVGDTYVLNTYEDALSIASSREVPRR